MKTVLLVEDNQKLAMALGIRLKAMGYIVYTSGDAVSAVSQVRKLAPDVVLMDISLPGGDGFMVAERISRLDAARATPIIFITASQRTDLPERAKRMGAVAFLRKPFDATELADAIESSLTPYGDWESGLQAVEAH